MDEVDDRREEFAEESAPSSEAWGRRLQRGEPEAVQEVRNRVARILAHGALDIPDPERDDLEQEVMTEIWQAVNRSHFDFTAGFWGLVEVITSRRSIDWLRARRERISVHDGAVSPTKGPLHKTLERERSELASQILAALDPRCRELITRRLADELSYREIAQAMGKTEGALRVQLYRCIDRARKLMGKLAQDRSDLI